jgi:hypothetical protein
VKYAAGAASSSDTWDIFGRACATQDRGDLDGKRDAGSLHHHHHNNNNNMTPPHLRHLQRHHQLSVLAAAAGTPGRGVHLCSSFSSDEDNGPGSSSSPRDQMIGEYRTLIP